MGLLDDASSIATEMHQSTKLTRTYKAVEDGVTAVQSANTTRWNSDLACARTVVSNKKAIKDAYDALDLPRPLTESQFF